METTANNTNPTTGTSSAATPQANAQQSGQTQTKASELANTPVDDKIYACTIQCAIRRKPGLVGLPGQDPAERVYKIGASLDVRSKGNLKGISGELEQKFMPEIIGVSANDASFRRRIEEYWSSIGKAVPADEPFLKDHEKGIKILLEFRVVGKARKERMDSILKVQEKIELLNNWLILETKEGSKKYIATLDDASIADFLLLNYALKYSKVANSFEDIDKSPKIDFYIYEKEVSVKNQLNIIDLRQKAMAIYQDLSGEERKTDAVLIMFNDNPADYDSQIDKLLRIDELYNASQDSMRRFVDYCSDAAWETKYLVKLAITLNKLRNPVNTNAIYYGDLMIGTSIDDAVLFLNNDAQGKDIKAVLLSETHKR